MSDQEYMEKLEDHARDIMNSTLEIMELLDDNNHLKERVQELERTVSSHGPEGRNYTNLQYVLLRNENVRLREALEFYANPKNYEPLDNSYTCMVEGDGGESARRVLREMGE